MNQGTQLITILGTGKYEETTYTFQEKEKHTRYVSLALIEFFQPSSVTVLLTEDARNAHWQKLNETAHDALQDVPPFYDLPIPSGSTEAEMWQLFDAVVSAVEPGAQVIFDITHSFRSIPMFVLLASIFIQKAKNASIEGLYYGAYNPKETHAPIFDLTPALKLLDWLTAVDKFMTTGSTLQIGQLLHSIQQDFYRSDQSGQFSEQAPPMYLQKLGKGVQSISDSIAMLRPFDLMQEAQKVQNLDLEALENEVGIFAKPFGLVFEQVQSAYGQFALDKPYSADITEVLDRQLKLINWYIDHDSFDQAILLSREWIISVLCVKYSLDYLDRDSREQVADALHRMRPDSSLDASRASFATIELDTELVTQLKPLWSKVVSCRNDIAHAQMRKPEAQNSASKLKKFAKDELKNKLSLIFPEFTANQS